MDDELFSSMRGQLLDEIAEEAVLTAPYTGRASFSERVMQVMGRVMRHEFVPVELQPYAYLNRPLPIGCDKTVSQPYIVALMTDLLDIGAGEVVLEIGAGAGYQAAVLAELAQQVHTVELIEELAAAARRRLHDLKYRNVEVHVGNGYYGLAQHAPYDKIMVTAACELIPPALLSQLKPGGRMVIPAGLAENQALLLVDKTPDGHLSTRELLPVRFSELDEPGAMGGVA
jgi:protein-L-isoaspartate(D-aspartate) O-methyltransferase